MDKQSSPGDGGKGSSEPDSEDSSSAPSFEKLKLEIHVVSSKHQTTPKHQCLSVHGRSTPEVQSVPESASKQSPSIPFAYVDSNIAQMEGEISISKQNLNSASSLKEDQENERDENDQESVNEQSYSKEMRTEAPSPMPSGDQGMILPFSNRDQIPSEMAHSVVGVDSLQQNLDVVLNNVEKAEATPQRFNFSDQEAQVSDTIPASGSVTAKANGSCPPERISSQRRSHWSKRDEGLQAPPPSYFECFGICPDQLPESPKPQGLPLPQQPKCREGGRVEGDVAMKHKRCQFCQPAILENNRDAQCEVLLFNEQQDESGRPQKVEDSTDHRLLAFLSCVMFWPVGLLAIYYANIAHTMKSEGFHQQSIHYSKRALGLSLSAISIGATMYLLFYMRNKMHF